jgi:AAA family ATP:ADP antiporter
MVFKTRYLLLMGLLLLTINWINTTGEYILGSIVKEQATALVAAGQAGGLTEEQVIGDFYAKYFTLANALGLFLQLFVVSRVVKYLGVSGALLILPALSFGAYNVIIFVPLLNAALGAKVVENATDYSLNNTVRNMLFLPCTYEEKFAGKQAIDSFFVRMGDVLSAALVFVGTTLLALPSRGFATVNAALAIMALALAWAVGRRYRALTAERTTRPAAA